MAQRGAVPALGLIGALLLGGCAQPAAVQPAAKNATTTTNTPGVTVANPRVPEATAGGPFPAVPSGYRGLGGAFFNEGKLIVVAPDMNAPMQKHDLDVGLLHGIAAGGYSESKPQTVQKADCQGAGDAPETAIKVNGAEPADEVIDGIACARLLHPGTHWLMSQLVTKGDGYISQIALRGDDGNTVIVYTDINRMANQLIDELGG